jgi:2-polyprenyl-6-methoxyphenol hydroxylase-like FAD-dependent oxidoreductase
MADYDIITVGGGLGGAALGKAMVEKGYRVLIVEREAKFKDRVRGEGMTTWGAAGVRELGLFEVFKEAGAHEPTYWRIYAGAAALEPRPFAETTPQGFSGLNFYHPRLQETLLAAAEKMGAEVRRDVRVREITPGPEPRTRLEWDSGEETVSARIVVAADGRGSMARKWGGFETEEDPPGNQIGGIFLENAPCPADSTVLVLNPFVSQLAIFMPQGDGTGRAYVATRAGSGVRFQGDRDVPRFMEEAARTGMTEDIIGGAKPAGPLATFDGSDSWVPHPYKDGIALIGDAAATTDPTWGQGLSLTLRDARVLRDALIANDDWDVAGHVYADAHADYYDKIRTVETMFTRVFMEPGPEADAIRARVLPQLAMDDMYIPDTFISGPELAPPTDEHRKRIYGGS